MSERGAIAQFFSKLLSFRLTPQGKYLADVLLLGFSNLALYYTVRYIMARNDPIKNMYRKRKEELSRKQVAGATPASAVQELQDRLRALRLTEHEEVIASEIVSSADESVSGFDQIAGLDHIVDSLKESVIYPLVYPHLFSGVGGKNSLLTAPKGVLLYGPPGCGKTHIAKALAKESGATFINVHVSTLTEKWFGESQKLVNALFSLAKKLEPSIIFIDEIDSFLRERRSSDHETTSMMKAELLCLWDGLASGENHRILVVGATNRPQDLDKAVLRRMPKRFAIKLPNSDQRRKILTLMLKGTVLDGDFDLDKIVLHSQGYSGSDLKELCRNAAMIPVREYLRSAKGNVASLESQNVNVRPLRTEDFFRGDGDDVNESYVEGDAEGFELEHDLD
ncbi:mitochondrial dynamin GTPase Msp1 [Blastocladiella emersonii ATCC 22665]|nr:mitochondrial dynamin GTPase Msp1 [Blastocladiella emersonii ATCC 22665]